MPADDLRYGASHTLAMSGREPTPNQQEIRTQRAASLVAQLQYSHTMPQFKGCGQANPWQQMSNIVAGAENRAKRQNRQDFSLGRAEKTGKWGETDRAGCSDGRMRCL